LASVLPSSPSSSSSSDDEDSLKSSSYARKGAFFGGSTQRKEGSLEGRKLNLPPIIASPSKKMKGKRRRFKLGCFDSSSDSSDDDERDIDLTAIKVQPAQPKLPHNNNSSDDEDGVGGVIEGDMEGNNDQEQPTTKQFGKGNKSKVLKPPSQNIELKPRLQASSSASSSSSSSSSSSMASAFIAPFKKHTNNGSDDDFWDDTDEVIVMSTQPIKKSKRQDSNSSSHSSSSTPRTSIATTSSTDTTTPSAKSQKLRITSKEICQKTPTTPISDDESMDILYPHIEDAPFYNNDASPLVLASQSLLGSVPLSITRYLKQYQCEGVAFMWKLIARDGGGLLADDSTFFSLNVYVCWCVNVSHNLWLETIYIFPI
jgi:hypothetical protein